MEKTVYENVFLCRAIDDRFFLIRADLTDPAVLFILGTALIGEKDSLNGSLPLPIAQNMILSISINTPIAIFVPEKEEMIEWTMAAMPPIAIGTAATRKIKDMIH